MAIKSIAVFCGSSLGSKDIFGESAYKLGAHLAQRNVQLVYGGAKIGLMGKVADGVLENNGTAIGILPDFLNRKEVAHPNLSEIISVKSMHERKMLMHEMTDATIAIPGGFGTMDELFEMLTWAQLGLHLKPTTLWNIDTYFDGLIDFIHQMNENGFVSDSNLNLILHHSDLNELFSLIDNYKAPEVPAWLNDNSQT